MQSFSFMLPAEEEEGEEEEGKKEEEEEEEGNNDGMEGKVAAEGAEQL